MKHDLRLDMVALLPRLRRFAYSMTGSLDEADDVVQAACERALSRLEQFEAGTRFDSWLFRIVQTTWIDRTRMSYRRNHDSDPEVVEAVPHHARIHEQAEARADLAVLRGEIASLPEDQRAVLALVTVEGMSYQEAADTLEIPIGTVMSRLSRARKKLAAALERAPDPLPREARRP